MSQDQDRAHSAGPDIRVGAPEGRAMGANICDESATRREGGQPPGHRWHTLVSCTLTTEYRPVRPPGAPESAELVTLGNYLVTLGNIFKFVMT